MLTPSEMERIVFAVRESFVISPDTEFTVEANPKTLSEEKLKKFVSLGVNRLSIGLQSIHENELKKLGRIHNYNDFADTYALARKCGIKNINIDLMYGIPEQTKESFAETLRTVAELSPEHISLYGLILEEGTPLYLNRHTISFPSEDNECDMYYYAADLLREKGYYHYEISNYAREGLECKHNLKYWQNKEYIGVGLSAYSYFDGKRFGNTKDLQEYLSGNYTEYSSTELIDKEAEAYEFVMLGLRTSEGISLDEYRERFDADFLHGRERLIDSLVNEGYVKLKGNRLSLSERGFYISNYLLTELL